ncbi:unnamed protein product [Litomosoides sigmodontis]|uniref:Tetraspanin n=1 Tax=Litomosoides sigmodontis TaxID=42156 RepID=A0A3P6TFF5_LITSI|nr:unnamed protein product [Litomosoides sigmodontis]
MGESGVCTVFINGILTILTFIYLAAGLAVVGLSLWLRFDPTFEETMRNNLLRINNSNAEVDELKNQIRFGLTISFWVICGCAILATLIGLIGVCGAIFSNRLMLTLNVIASVILIVVELSVLLFIILHKSSIKKATIQYVNLADEMDDLLDDMNAIRAMHKCCSTRDYNSSMCMAVDQLACTTATWNHLEWNLSVAGYSTAVIIIEQILTVLLCIAKIASND